MNYIAEIKAFHDLVQIKQLSTGQIALWYALMYINNKCTWIEWFTVPNLTLELNTGLSRSGIAKARNILKQHCIIDFKANGTKATSYRLISMLNSTQDSNQNIDLIAKSNQVSTQVGNQSSAQSSVQSSNQSSTQNRAPLNKLNKTKLNNNTTTNIESTNYIDTGGNLNQNSSSSFSQEEFQEIAKLYSENIALPNSTTAEWIVDMLNEYGVTWFKNAIVEANLAGKRFPNYIRGTLENWKIGGGMTLKKDKASQDKTSPEGSNKTYSDDEMDRFERLMWEKQNSG